EALPGLQIASVLDVPIDPAADLTVYVRSATAPAGEPLPFKLELNRAHTTDVLVQLTTSDDSAVASLDYARPVASVTIPAGQTSVDVPVRTLAYQASIATKQMFLDVSSSSTPNIGQARASGVIKATQQVLRFKKIFAANGANCGITDTNLVKCWGYNNYGALGDGTNVDSATPIEVKGLGPVKMLSTTHVHACVIDAQDKVKCWGANFGGALGDGTNTNSNVPIEVPGLTGATSIVAASNFSCALTAQETVKCWGQAMNAVPTDVPGLTGIKSFSAYFNVCGVLATGEVKCSGPNVFGSRGDGSATNGVTYPAANTVVGLTGAKSVSVGAFHACAITAQNSLVCWGSNRNGQLGNNSTVDSGSPVAATGLQGVTQVSAGEGRTCVTLSNATVRCWGANLTDPLASPQLTPLDVPGLSNVAEISAGTRICARS
ncbi:MAG: hypothetical protein AAB250_18325, partial [Bdellovibrionota bacterium]